MTDYIKREDDVISRQAKNDETRLSMIEKILTAINWRIRITGDGVIHVVPIPEPYEENEA